MQNSVSHQQDGQEEEREPACLITARLLDIQLKWLPIREYEEIGLENTHNKRTRKE